MTMMQNVPFRWATNYAYGKLIVKMAYFKVDSSFYPYLKKERKKKRKEKKDFPF